MGFRCGNCGQHTEGKARRVVTVRREKVYPTRTYIVRKLNGKRRATAVDPGGRGYETVVEELRCRRIGCSLASVVTLPAETGGIVTFTKER